MNQRTVWAICASAVVVACGGTSSTIGNGPGDDGGSDGASSSGSGSGGSGSGSGSGGSSSGGKDGGSSSGLDAGSSSGAGDGGGASCDGGTTACGGACVDTSTDPKNCGGCGVVCNTICAGGICPLLPADAGTPPTVGDNACLTVDATSVYWGTGQANGSVWKVPTGGGSPSQVIGGQAAPHAMASDGTNLFFGNQGVSATCTGSIQRVAVGGGQATPVATQQCSPLDVVVDATNVYWTSSGDGSVWKSDKATPNPVNLVPASSANHAGYLRVDATNVYFTDPAAGALNRVPIAGGPVTAVTTSGIPAPGHVAIDATTAYFGSRSNTSAAILSVALTGNGASPAQLVTNLPAINGIETDGAHLWFAEATNVQPYKAGTGEIHRVTVAGASGAILAGAQNGPNCVAVDATSVYWIDTGGGTISKTGK